MYSICANSNHSHNLTTTTTTTTTTRELTTPLLKRFKAIPKSPKPLFSKTHVFSVCYVVP